MSLYTSTPCAALAGLAAFALTLAGSMGVAQQAGSPAIPATPSDKRPIAAGDVHVENSRVFVFVGKRGLGHEHAIEGRLSAGRVQLGQASEAGELVFDMTGFSADTDSSRKFIGLSGTTDANTQREVTANMLGEAVLDVARHPTARLKIRSANWLPEKSAHGRARVRFDGEFTLHGVTRPVQIAAEADTAGAWWHVRGGFSILQSQYGITPFSKALGAIGVSDELRIYGDLWIARSAGMVPTARRPDATSR